MIRARRTFIGCLLALLVGSFSVTANAQQQQNAWNVSLLGGANFITSDIEGDLISPGITSMPAGHDPAAGFFVGTAAAYTVDLGSNWSLDLEAEVSYRRNSADDTIVAGVSFNSLGITTDGYVSNVSLMVNAIAAYQITETGFMPFIGGGAGVAFVNANVDNTDGGVTLNLVDDSDTAFAYQLIAGVAYKFTPNLIVATEYRFFGVAGTEFDTNPAVFVAGTKFEADGFQSNSIMLRLTYRFSLGSRP